MRRVLSLLTPPERLVFDMGFKLVYVGICTAELTGQGISKLDGLLQWQPLPGFGRSRRSLALRTQANTVVALAALSETICALHPITASFAATGSAKASS